MLCVLLSSRPLPHASLSDEESQLVQERVDSLRIRYSVLSLSSVDVLQRLEQALEASSRCTSSQEDLHLWLGRIERELLGAGSQAPLGAGDAALCAAERQRVRQRICQRNRQTGILTRNEEKKCTTYIY